VTQLEVGNQFGRLTVIARVIGRRVPVVCACGVKKTVDKYKLLGGTTRSCGCLRDSLIQQVNLSHGQTGTRLYHCWTSMLQRCSNPKAQGYKNYGGRGIRVCKDWEVFDVFAAWAQANGYQDELTIDREHTDGNYEPANCRWATYSQQAQNRRKQQGTKSKYLGVSVREDMGVYVAYANRRRLGYFDDEFSAAWVRDTYMRQCSDRCTRLNSLVDRRQQSCLVKYERRGCFDWSKIFNK
jgi:hypothetical protein